MIVNPGSIAAPPSVYSSSFIGHGVPSEHDRLRTLEAYADPHTFAIIDRLGLPGDIECLELGAGSGSVARYLSARKAESATLLFPGKVPLPGGPGYVSDHVGLRAMLFLVPAPRLW
jgi:hypothetical protein